MRASRAPDGAMIARRWRIIDAGPRPVRVRPFSPEDIPVTAKVTVSFGNDREFEYHVERNLTREAASRWLDEQFVELGAEPLRLSGKILLADKILAVAAAAGPSRVGYEEPWSVTFAAAAASALERDVVRVDVDKATVGY